MARKSPKCPPTVEPKQFGCVWNFSGMFDHHHHHHGRPNRKLLSDDSHGSKALPGAGHARSQVRMLTFDEQLRSINIESKKKTASVDRSLKGEISSSKNTRKNDEVWKDTVERSFWKKIISRYENPNKKKKNPSFVDRIVVLKPSQHVVEYPVDVGCRCSYLQSHTSKQQIVKHTHFSFSDVRKKLKNAKKPKNTRKTRSCEASEDGESSNSASKMGESSMVPFSKQQEPDVFVEARRHLAERLRQVAKGEDEPSASSSKQASRTLERILLLSPVHDSMATFGREPKGTHSEKSLQSRKEKTWSGSSPLKQNKDSRASGCVEITDANDFLQGDSEFSEMGSDLKNIGAMGGNRSIEGPRLEFSLDVSSLKADCICKSETMDNDQFRENPSPVSVLESFFVDNISSPTSTIESVELQIQPRRLDFEEHSLQTSSPPCRKTSLGTFMVDREFIFAYVNAVYQTSRSNWEDFLATGHPSDSSCDHKLLHDCVKEVLISLHSPWIAFIDSKVRPFSLEKDVVNVVMERVDWHNGQPVVPRTLDLLIGRDIAKSGTWVDNISDRIDIVFEVVDETLQELIMEAIFDIHV